ncbi:PAS domain S-box protein [Imhoffiella purpurea]|uniref:histidine kinase n=1 Tax=Imhoffiella purpurea TaxID=1249627 RepID=W9V9P0_9GAMM|nr:PAS domain S-box protein [Imhoffiella purpurea]EXJ16169.1 hypothetical protein D779_0474 [Imhoffiella purpurea]
MTDHPRVQKKMTDPRQRERLGIAPSLILAVLLALGVCALLFWHHVEHRSTLQESVDALDHLRQAQTELAKGFLHWSLADDSESPFDRAGGLALMRQAIGDFEDSLERLYPDPQPERGRFRHDAQAFGQVLDEWTRADAPDTRQLVELRILYGELERQADRLDREARHRIRLLAIRTDRNFALTLGGSALAFLFTTALLILALRRQRSALIAREQARTELDRSEGRFEATFEQAAMGLAMVSPDGRFLRINERLCEILGYDRRDLLGKTFQEITHAEDLDTDLAQVQRLLDGKIDRYGMEKRYLRGDGGYLWASLTVSLVRQADGEPEYFIAAIEDMSARKSMEEALRESEGRLRLFIEHAPSALAMFDREMRYLCASRRWRDDFGLGEQDLLGRSHYEIFPEIPERWKAVHRRGMAGEVLHADEDWFRRMDGRIQWQRWEVRPWFGADGSVGGIVTFAEDISARKEAEIALSDSRERLRTIVRSIPDLVWLKDPEGVFIICNARFEKLFGAPEEEIVGKTDYDFVDPELADFFRAKDLAAIASGGPSINEEEVTFASDGHSELLQVIKTPLYSSDGSLIGVLGIARDITRIMRTEQELEHHRHHLEEMVEERTRELIQARAEAERLASVKSEFLANMSHEIRTPMNAVLGLAYLLERQTLPEEAREFARKIQHSGRILLGIINDILDFSRIESGRIEIEHAPFRLSEVLDTLATLMTSSAESKHIDLAIRPPDGLDPVLLGDPLRLGQILINLTGNAIKFTEEGRVEVRIEPLEHTPTRIGLRFSVRDTGIGIDAQTQTRLFQAFTQADASTTRRFGGSGLGLAICRRLTELMGSSLELDSAPGKGSTFWLDLTFDLAEPESEPRPSEGPKRPPDPERIEAPSPLDRAVSEEAREDRQPPRLAGLRLLVVDDCEINREVAHQIFADEGAEVHLLADGHEAVDWLTAHPDAVDMVLMDVHMPLMDGLTATRLIRRRPSLLRIPIVALTADALSPQKNAALDAGMDAFLSKPFDIPETIELIRRLTGSAPDPETHGMDQRDPSKEHRQA